MPSYLSHTQQFTNVSVFCGVKFNFNTYAKQVMGERHWKPGHSKSPDFNMCNYYSLYETMIYSVQMTRIPSKKEKKTFNEKLPTFEDKVRCSSCQELFSEGVRPALQLDVSTLRFFYETRQVPGKQQTQIPSRCKLRM